eukprot:206112_1
MAEVKYVELYSQLTNMGFASDISLNAAKNCEYINEAIEWIENKTNIAKNEHKSVDIKCNGNISNCFALKKIISILKFYNNNYMNYNILNEYLNKNKCYVISGYHHILDNHLNEDNIALIESNKEMREMTNIINNNLQCNISKCEIYVRNNRCREKKNIECNDEKLCIYIDIIDTIHCYFLHSIDIGYKIIHNLH